MSSTPPPPPPQLYSHIGSSGVSADFKPVGHVEKLQVDKFDTATETF